jgi:S-adenosylmethionine hydrolase
MNKSEFIDAVAEKAKLSKKDAKSAVDAVVSFGNIYTSSTIKYLSKYNLSTTIQLTTHLYFPYYS